MKLLNYILSFLPTSLPVGATEFEKFAADIRALVGKGFEQVSQDDFKYIIATNIMHIGPQRNRVPKQWFVRTLRKAAANQIAGQVFADIKTRHDAAVKAAQPQPAEVTAPPAGVTDGQAEKVQAAN